MIGRILAAGFVCIGMAMGQTVNAPRAAVVPAPSGVAVPTGATAAVAPAKASTAAANAFDVVTIRPSKPGDKGILGVGPDQYQALGVPLGVTILTAYYPVAIGSKDRILGAPDWVWTDPYNIVAKVAPADVARWQKQPPWDLMAPDVMLQGMLQAMLAQQCKLVVHRIPGEISGYALVVGKRGPQLKMANPGETVPANAQVIPGDGRMVPITSRDNPVITFFQTSMASLAAHISRAYGTLVVDRTGLSGKFDFTLTRLNLVPNPSTALDVSELGLELQPIKIPTENLVVDHIERPAEN
jgi:uncharacterized protein (TIGR03435 family)